MRTFIRTDLPNPVIPPRLPCFEFSEKQYFEGSLESPFIFPNLANTLSLEEANHIGASSNIIGSFIVIILAGSKSPLNNASVDLGILISIGYFNVPLLSNLACSILSTCFIKVENRRRFPVPSEKSPLYNVTLFLISLSLNVNIFNLS